MATSTDWMTARRTAATPVKKLDAGVWAFAAAAALVVSSCSSGSAGSAQSATGATNATESSEESEVSSGSTDSDGSTTPDADTTPDTAAADPTTADPTTNAPQEPVGPPAIAHEALIGIDPVRLALPFVPAISLPDLSELNETGSALEDQLGEFLDAGQGLDVLSADCVAQGGELAYQASQDGEGFLDVETDGSGTYESFAGDGIVTVQVNADGSGTYRSTSPKADISIVANADESGTYTGSLEEGNVSVIVMPDGSGVYASEYPEGTLTVSIDADGSGSYVASTIADDITIDVNADGSGVYTSFSAAGTLSLESRLDGTLEYLNSSPDIENTLVVNADGSGIYSESSGRGELLLEVDAAGRGTYDFRPIGLDRVEIAFTSDIGILDPAVLGVNPLPTFSVATGFPPFSALGSLQPPCVTVVRLSSEVLFDEGSDELRPESFPVLDRLAAALAETGQSIEVHGHTDALGSEDFNLELSERRAANFASALVERGVTSEIISLGFGETRPVAPNTTADGADDPSGRQLNRRVEVVVNG